VRDLPGAGLPVADQRRQPRAQLRHEVLSKQWSTLPSRSGSRLAAVDIDTVPVTSDNRTVDMIEEGYDLVIRVNPDPDENCHCH
jgi:hypothetical protein